MKDKKRVVEIVTGISLVIFIGIALYLRIGLAYDRVFSGDIIKFAGYDSWYYLRLVDNLLHHFPRIITFDPYTFFPHGLDVFWHPFFTFLIGSVALLAGLGSPTQHLVDTVASYTPAILGALTVVPVFYLGKELFNRWAGIIAAMLIAIMPGEFLGRSMLGFADHHVVETLFIAISLLLLVKAIRWANKSQLSFSHISNHDWSIIKTPFIFTVLGSIFFSVYILSWVAGVMFIFVIFIYIVVQFVIDHLRGESTEYLAIVNTVFFFIVAIIILPVVLRSAYNVLYALSLTVAIIVPPVLWYISYLMRKHTCKNWFFPLLLVIAAIVAIGIFYVVDPSLFNYTLHRFEIFNPVGPILVITEAQPLLFENGHLDLSLAFYNFGTGFLFSIVTLIILICGIIKQNDRGKTLLIVWSVIVFFAALGQRRYAYYLAVNIAILTGYFAWLMVQKLGLDTGTIAFAKTYKDKKQKKQKQKDKLKQHSSTSLKPAGFAFAIFLIAVVIVYPTVASPPGIGPLGKEGGLLAVHRIRNALFIDDALYTTLMWLKDNTPDPFDNPEFYYNLYKEPEASEDYDYPDTAYGIMSLWDYGHMITRIAHRIPVCNPHLAGANIAAKYFTEQSESSANEIADELGVRYVIVDNDMAIQKFQSIVRFANKNTEDFFDIYYRPENGRLRGDYYFYPEYYSSLVVRLYNFDGGSVIPRETTLIRYQEKTFPEGDKYKEITETIKFPNYDAALDYAKNLNTPMYKIVGTDPFVSPIPLEPLKDYELVYSSKETTTHLGLGNISSVKVFEYKSSRNDLNN